MGDTKEIERIRATTDAALCPYDGTAIEDLKTLLGALDELTERLVALQDAQSVRTAAYAIVERDIDELQCDVRYEWGESWLLEDMGGQNRRSKGSTLLEAVTALLPE